MGSTSVSPSSQFQTPRLIRRPRPYSSPVSVKFWWRQSSLMMFSATSSLSSTNHNWRREHSLFIDVNPERGVSHIDYVVRTLHKFAESFALDLQCNPLAKNYQKLAKAWVGVDMDLWYLQVSYKAAICALFQRTVELVNEHEEKHGKDPTPIHQQAMQSEFAVSPICEILNPKVSLLMECVRAQLSIKDPMLVKWFEVDQFPIMKIYLTLVYERWSKEYTECLEMVEDKENCQRVSSLMVIILAIICCIAVNKLATRHISCPGLAMPLYDEIKELFDLAYELSPLDKLYNVATKTGLEDEFLHQFGSKVFHPERSQDLIFWMALFQSKLIAAFENENVVATLQMFCNSKVLVSDLAILGLFSFLGLKTRLFLSSMGITDFDETIKDFICYMECGILFFYPELPSECLYQLFMEVVNEEMRWLDFYTAVSCMKHPQKRAKAKHHASQAKKEMIFSTVFDVCSYIFSNIDSCYNTTEQPLDAKMATFLLQSKFLLNTCQEIYLAAYDESQEVLKIAEVDTLTELMHLRNARMEKSLKQNIDFNEQYGGLVATVTAKCTPQNTVQENMPICSDNILEKFANDEADSTSKSFFSFSSICLVSSISNICMGTQLLFMDLSISFGLLWKQVFGHSPSKRERKRIARTVADVLSIVPIAILMLLPLTAIGHAAILSGIKRYLPGLIPSPYSVERLDVIKQLKRAKKMGLFSSTSI